MFSVIHTFNTMTNNQKLAIYEIVLWLNYVHDYVVADYYIQFTGSENLRKKTLLLLQICIHTYIHIPPKCLFQKLTA